MSDWVGTSENGILFNFIFLVFKTILRTVKLQLRLGLKVQFTINSLGSSNIRIHFDNLSGSWDIKKRKKSGRF